MASDVKDCDNCGLSPIVISDHDHGCYVECSYGCGVRGPACETSEEAVAKWDRLYMRPEEKVEEAVNSTLTKLHLRASGSQFGMTFEPADSNGCKFRIYQGPHFGAMEDEQLCEWAFEALGVTTKREKSRLRKIATIFRDRDDRPGTTGDRDVE